MKKSLFVAALLALALSGCPDTANQNGDEASPGVEQTASDSSANEASADLIEPSIDESSAAPQQTAVPEASAQGEASEAGAEASVAQ